MGSQFWPLETSLPCRLPHCHVLHDASQDLSCGEELLRACQRVGGGTVVRLIALGCLAHAITPQGLSALAHGLAPGGRRLSLCSEGDAVSKATSSEQRYMSGRIA
ncbi:hypothetical protein HAX54_000537 [Datura stramonium]|uniref:Uncharacterized protein n=1 Tax=Datura stramonium TaxID=4076 RepID=A0ABS8WS82_DATST|nr:hypothetical protein [Datura stramonium]